MTKKFDFCKYGMTVSVSYWSKDFTISYFHPKYGLFKYGEHMMYCVPVAFNQEKIEERTSSAIKLFQLAESWLDKYCMVLEFLHNNSEKIKKSHNDYLQGLASDIDLQVTIYDEISLLVAHNSKLAHVITNYYFRTFIGLEPRI